MSSATSIRCRMVSRSIDTVARSGPGGSGGDLPTIPPQEDGTAPSMPVSISRKRPPARTGQIPAHLRSFTGTRNNPAISGIRPSAACPQAGFAIGIVEAAVNPPPSGRGHKASCPLTRRCRAGKHPLASREPSGAHGGMPVPACGGLRTTGAPAAAREAGSLVTHGEVHHACG